MSRGGTRKGAGRKPALSRREGLRIGGECERLWREKSERAALERAAKRLKKHDIADIRKGFSDVPPGAARETVLKWSRNPGTIPDDPETLSEAAHDLHDARKSLDEIGRFRTEAMTRPQRAGDDVIRAAMKLESRESNRLSARMVRRCWDEFRKFERQAIAQRKQVSDDI
jgi:hypothetical protein